MKKHVIESDKLPPPAASYSQGWAIEIAGAKILMISGQVSEDEKGNLVAPEDFEGQVRQVFKNLEAALEAEGATLNDIVFTRILLTDESHWKRYEPIRKEYFKKPYPASTLRVVRSLADPTWLVEVEAIAVVKSSG